VALLFAMPRLAHAQRVALVRPAANDPVLVDAFNRLRAELHIHHFDEQVVATEADGVTTTEPPSLPFQELARIAQRTEALAAIAFVRDIDKTSVDVWLLDRISGKATMRTLEIEPTQDAASILAIRAVDLLRASLREFRAGERPPNDVAGVDRRPVPPAIEAFAYVPPSRSTFALEVDAMLLDDRPNFGLAYGPQVGFLYRAADRIELGLVLAAPLVGGKWKTGESSASVRQEIGWAEARFMVFGTSRFELAFHLGLGAHLMQVQGQAPPPQLSSSDQVSSWLGTAGLRGQLILSPHAALALSARAIALTPRPGVAVEQEGARDTSILELPILALSAGLVVGL
jgi:hypothetical protein